MIRALVCGAGGFIGGYLVRRLKAEGTWVCGVDLRYPEFSKSLADRFVIGDLRDAAFCTSVLSQGFHEVYQLAADMGGAGYIFAGDNDASLMRSSALINLNLVELCRQNDVGRVFYASSACVYSAHNQVDPDSPECSEDSAYPAAPDSEYGWEKLFSERLYLAHARNHGLTVRIARYHNIFGSECAWTGGREKVPAALCRKVALAPPGGSIEIWGDGRQTRSFLSIDACIEGTLRLMRSDYPGPVNIGSEEMISINGLADMIMTVAAKPLTVRHVAGPLGVRGRRSDNRLIRARLGWEPTESLASGIAILYAWVAQQAAAGTASRC
jgi:nucleoside-diphosphate-sugar epimerase